MECVSLSGASARCKRSGWVFGLKGLMRPQRPHLARPVGQPLRRGRRAHSPGLVRSGPPRAPRPGRRAGGAERPGEEVRWHGIRDAHLRPYLPGAARRAAATGPRESPGLSHNAFRARSGTQTGAARAAHSPHRVGAGWAGPPLLLLIGSFFCSSHFARPFGALLSAAFRDATAVSKKKKKIKFKFGEIYTLF